MKRKLQHLFSALVFAGFIFIAFGSVDDDKPKKRNFRTHRSTYSETENSKSDVEILKHSAQYDQTMSSYTIHCRVKNNTSDLINYLDLKATFYDKDGNIVGTGIGNATNFAAGAEKTIDVLALDIQNSETYEVEVGNVMN